MKTRTWVGALGVAAALASLSVQAQTWGRGGGPHRGAEERREPPAQMAPPREFRRDDFRRDEAPLPGRGQMSPEERRQLRRDIHDAGQDLYRREPPRRRF